MFLGIIRATADQNVPPKKSKTKSKARAGAVHGVTEGEKRRLAKETGPVTKDVPVTQVITEKIQQADPVVRARLQGILEEFRDVFPDKLPYGPPPKRHIDHEIDLVPGEAPPHKTVTGSATQKWRNSDARSRRCLSKGGSGQVQALMERQCCLCRRKTANGTCAWTTGR